MASTPRVSVCIDVYNYARFVGEAVRSVLRQTLADFELLVVDDCSTDESASVAEKAAGGDPRVQVFRSARNLGMVSNRNACLALAKGEYVKFVHADDFLRSETALEQMAAALDACPGAALAAAAVQHVDAMGRPLRPAPAAPSWRCSGAAEICRCLVELKNRIGGPSAVLFRRSLAARGFDERYFHAADLEMWFHLLEQGSYVRLGDAVAAYRWHADQQTVRDLQTLSQAQDWRRLLDTYLERDYVRLRPWIKAYLRREILRQALKRCMRTGQAAEARKLLSEAGRWEYARLAPAQYALRRTRGIESLWGGRSLPPRRDAPARSGKPPGINIAGFFRGEYGLGESARAFAAAAEASGLPCALNNIDSAVHRNLAEAGLRFSGANPYCLNLMAFSFDYSRRHYLDLGAGYFKDRRNVGLWYWELPVYPAQFQLNFDYYDEIWAPSTFCKEAFERVSPIPVRAVTYPLPQFRLVPGAREDLGLFTGCPLFLTVFDFHSTVARKNPLGVIEAFRRAFGASREAALVVKCMNGDRYPELLKRLRGAAGAIQAAVLDQVMGQAQMDRLYCAASCFVSLHRSEGLGLGMAQAMALGKPVIATAYSGNMDFMDSSSAFLVDYRLASIDETAGPYAAGGVWAEPDLDCAAEHMRWVARNHEAAKALGRAGRARVRQALDPARTAQQMRAAVAEAAGVRLEDIETLCSAAPGRGLSPSPQGEGAGG